MVIVAQLDAREGKMRGFRIDDFSLPIEEKPNQINPKSLPVVIVAQLDAREGRILTGLLHRVGGYLHRQESFNLDAREGRILTGSKLAN